MPDTVVGNRLLFLLLMGLINGKELGTDAPLLSDMLFEKPNRTFGSLAALPSNIEAVEAALLFATGANALVALVGASGLGKSHLLEAVSIRLGQEHGEKPDVQTATEYLSIGNRADSEFLILDDVQEVLSKPRHRQTLRLALERRVKKYRPTLLAFTQTKTSRQLSAFLPCAREWVVSTILAPKTEERVLLLNQLAKAEGLSLSPSLIRIIAIQMQGNGRTLAGALKRLRLAGPVWLDSRATLMACGLLDPFFADNSAWDLKHRILLTAESTKVQFSKALGLDLALFVMLHEAGLGEADVARAAGIAPAEAYLRANRFAKQALESAETHAYVCQFVETVVSALATE